MSASPALPALALPGRVPPGTDRTLPRRSGEALARFPVHPV